VFLYENETSQDETVQVRVAEPCPIYPSLPGCSSLSAYCGRARCHDSFAFRSCTGVTPALVPMF